MTDGVKDAGLASLCGLGTALDGFKGTAPGSAAGEAKDAMGFPVNVSPSNILHLAFVSKED